MFPEIINENFEKMSLPVNIVWHDTQHIYISIIAIRLQTIAAENLEAIPQPFKINNRVIFSINILNPLHHDLSKFCYNPLPQSARLRVVIIAVLG